MIKLSEDDIDIIHVNEFYCHVRFSSLEGYEIEWTDEQAHELKKQIIINMKTVEELKKRIEGLDVEYVKLMEKGLNEDALEVTLIKNTLQKILEKK